LSLEDHQAQRVTPALLEWADHIVCMTEGHRRALERDHPGSGAQTLGREISDPVGQTLPVYERCAEQIEQALQAWLAQQNQ
jgi:protein-tyrosine phosphatase